MCFAWGDPHVVTFDNAKNDVYGIAQYTMAESSGFASIPPFKLKINTYDHPRWPHPATEKSYFQFTMRNGQKTEIELTMNGESNIFIDGIWKQLYPQGNNDFKITKIGNKVEITTWYGITVTDHIFNLEIRLI